MWKKEFLDDFSYIWQSIFIERSIIFWHQKLFLIVLISQNLVTIFNWYSGIDFYWLKFIIDPVTHVLADILSGFDWYYLCQDMFSGALRCAFASIYPPNMFHKHYVHFRSTHSTFIYHFQLKFNTNLPFYPPTLFLIMQRNVKIIYRQRVIFIK